MLKVFYGDDTFESLGITELEKNNKIKRITPSSDIYVINPLYIEEVENQLKSNFSELTKYMKEEFTDYNYEGVMEVDSLWDNPFSINIEVPVSVLIDGNKPEIYDYEHEIYNSDNPYDIIWEKINSLGRSILESQLKEMLEESKTASFR